jgi:hypothetical protein
MRYTSRVKQNVKARSRLISYLLSIHSEVWDVTHSRLLDYVSEHDPDGSSTSTSALYGYNTDVRVIMREFYELIKLLDVEPELISYKFLAKVDPSTAKGLDTSGSYSDQAFRDSYNETI